MGLRLRDSVFYFLWVERDCNQIQLPVSFGKWLLSFRIFSSLCTLLKVFCFFAAAFGRHFGWCRVG
eukprot:NODE_7118_length_268_cov_232.292237_g6505_i0.p1 GENE.NODE_7118_length_268_cov_232.292237_g6505_i0~~NODE_7118_length_268_cov_232.292237_g6505_i0.p1  ORF type:complete len:77 (+),score=19.69 NODE_7118_length_268_cov_232.292237_g6505_i0:34-231(+)